MDFHSKLRQVSLEFRSRLTPEDIVTMKFGRYCFILSLLAPAIVYFSGFGPDEEPKFPCTVSHSIRGGLPWLTNQIFWIPGWYVNLKIINAKGPDFMKFFCHQMVATGLVMSAFFPIGKTRFKNKMHLVLALAYMFDHHVLFYLYNHTTIWRASFYFCFFVFLWCIKEKKRLCIKYGLAGEEDPEHVRNGRTSIKEFSKKNPKIGKKIFKLDLAIMILENGLFFSYILGIPSGLTRKDIGPQILKTALKN